MRYLPAEERFAEVGREKEFDEQLRPRGVSRYGKSEYLRSGAVEKTERLLGITLVEFEALERVKAGAVKTERMTMLEFLNSEASKEALKKIRKPA